MPEKYGIKCLFYLTKFEEWYKVKDRVVTRESTEKIGLLLLMK